MTDSNWYNEMVFSNFNLIYFLIFILGYSCSQETWKNCDLDPYLYGKESAKEGDWKEDLAKIDKRCSNYSYKDRIKFLDGVRDTGFELCTDWKLKKKSSKKINWDLVAKRDVFEGRPAEWKDQYSDCANFSLKFPKSAYLSYRKKYLDKFCLYSRGRYFGKLNRPNPNICPSDKFDKGYRDGQVVWQARQLFDESRDKTEEFEKLRERYEELNRELNNLQVSIKNDPEALTQDLVELRYRRDELERYLSELRASDASGEEISEIEAQLNSVRDQIRDTEIGHKDGIQRKKRRIIAIQKLLPSIQKESELRSRQAAEAEKRSSKLRSTVSEPEFEL